MSPYCAEAAVVVAKKIRNIENTKELIPFVQCGSSIGKQPWCGISLPLQRAVKKNPMLLPCGPLIFFMRPILLSPLLLPSHCHAAIAPHKYMGSHLMAENALTHLPLSEINRWNRSLRTHRREKEKSETRTAHLAPSLMLNRNTASWRRL